MHMSVAINLFLSRSLKMGLVFLPVFPAGQFKHAFTNIRERPYTHKRTLAQAFPLQLDPRELLKSLITQLVSLEALKLVGGTVSNIIPL